MKLKVKKEISHLHHSTDQQLWVDHPVLKSAHHILVKKVSKYFYNFHMSIIFVMVLFNWGSKSSILSSFTISIFIGMINFLSPRCVNDQILSIVGFKYLSFFKKVKRIDFMKVLFKMVKIFGMNWIEWKNIGLMTIF